MAPLLLLLAVACTGADLESPRATAPAEGVPVLSAPIIPDVPKDAIPPLDSPKYENPDEVSDWLTDDDLILGVAFDGDARAYPIRIMNWHEIVNERIGNQDVVVTYCPLCRSGIVFDRQLDGTTLTFGNTGALYESAMVMYDRETESYWYQVGGVELKGELAGRRLRLLPSFLTNWREWRELHPETKVLSMDTGFRRDYGRGPNTAYEALNSSPAFPVSHSDGRLAPKEKVVGIVVDGVAKAYPIRLAEAEPISDAIGSQEIVVEPGQSKDSARVYYAADGERKLAPVVATFWFAWVAAYPDTLVFSR